MGTGSRGGVKIPRKTIHPDGRKYKMQPREFVPREKDSTSRNSPLVSSNAAARWWCSGEKGYQDRLPLLSLLLPRAGQAKTHPQHLSCPLEAGWGSPAMTLASLEGREEFLKEEGEKELEAALCPASTGTRTHASPATSCASMKTQCQDTRLDISRHAMSF